LKTALPLGIVAILFATGAASAADPAAYFPPGTLAYAELHDPAAAAPQLAAAFKGSQLEDSIAFIQQRREKSKDPRDHFMKDQLAVLGLLASPEMATELKRLGGVAFGLTGPNDWAAVVLTGDSAAAGLAARALLTMTSVRKVAAAGDVPLYQFKQLPMTYDPNGRQILQNEKLAAGATDYTFAYVPGLFVAGSGPAPVTEIVTRFKGAAKGSLAEQPDFKAAAGSYRRPGVFVYANAPAYFAKRDETQRKADPATSPEREPDSLAWFKLLANAKAVRSVAGHLSFRDGGLAASFGCGLEAGQKSPLFDLLAAPGVKLEALKHAPMPATIAVAVSFPEANRAAAILAFLDSVAKANGELGRTPGEVVKEMEAKLKVSIVDALIAKTTGATLVLPVKQDLPKGAVELPILTLHGESASVASGWSEFLPKLIGDLSGEAAPQISTETIDGVKVVTVPAGNLPWRAAVHFAQKGETFTIGLDRRLVAAAANGGTPATPTLPANGAAAVGRIGPGGLVRMLAAEKPVVGLVVPRGPATPVKPMPGGGGFGGGLDFEGPIPVEPGNLPENTQKKEAEAKAALFAALDALPVASFTARRTGPDIRIELFQPKVHGAGLAPFINASVGWYDQILNRKINPNQGYGPRYGRFHGEW